MYNINQYKFGIYHPNFTLTPITVIKYKIHALNIYKYNKTTCND